MHDAFVEEPIGKEKRPPLDVESGVPRLYVASRDGGLPYGAISELKLSTCTVAMYGDEFNSNENSAKGARRGYRLV